MPWIWSDDLANTLVRAGLADRDQVSRLLHRPRAVVVDAQDPLQSLAALADDDEETDQRRVA